jgi:fructose 1,6-bisphosphatase
MAQSGFEEAQTSYAHTNGATFVGQVRRFGPFGAAYEVVDIKPSGELVVHVFDNGEQLSYSVAEFLADPIAETIP